MNAVTTTQLVSSSNDGANLPLRLILYPAEIRASDCFVAARSLLAIQKKFQEWTDPLSQGLHGWVDDVSDFLEAEIISTTASDEEIVANVADRIDRLIQGPLLDRMDRMVVRNPLFEEGRWVWSEDLLTRCRQLTTISPFTGRPFAAIPHRFARAMVDWLRGLSFIPPSHFPTSSTTALVESTTYPNERDQVDQLQLALFRENAASIVILEENRRLREQARMIHQSMLQTLQRTQETNRQIEAMTRRENSEQLRRVNERMDHVEATFGVSLASLQSTLTIEQQQHERTHVQLVAAHGRIDGLEARTRQLENEKAALYGALAHAERRLGDSNCLIL